MAHAKKKKGVQKQDIALIGVTFFVGIAAGWYLYVTAFATHFDPLVGHGEAVYEDLVLIGDAYSSTMPEGTAPSFQILKDGSYNYVTYVADGVPNNHREGTLPAALWKEVKADLTKAKLAQLSAPVERASCVSDGGGTDYSYDVTLESVPYTLDTCTTVLGQHPDVVATLDKLWNYFATLDEVKE